MISAEKNAHCVGCNRALARIAPIRLGRRDVGAMRFAYCTLRFPAAPSVLSPNVTARARCAGGALA